MGGVNALLAAQFAAAGICLALGLQHAFVWARGRRNPARLLIAIAALAVLGNALVEARMYTAETPAQFGTALKWSVVFIDLFLAALIWFVVSWTGNARRWLAIAATAVLGFVLVLNLLSPFSIVYSEITSIAAIALPWGGSIASAVGTAGPWKLLGDLPGILLAILVLDSCVRLWRNGNRHEAWVIGLSVGAFIPALTIHELLVDLGVLSFPYVLTFAFLGILLVLSFELAGQVVRAARLSDEIVERERRWRTLMERIRLLVMGLDSGGRIDYVNPFFLEVSGYDPDQVIGRRFEDLVPESERADVIECVRDSLAGSAPPQVTRTLVTAGEEARTIRWSNVALGSSVDDPPAVLRVGADMTGQLRAEVARDEAIAELEEFKRQLEQENVYLREELESSRGFEEIVGDSDELLYVLHRIEQVSGTDTTVLIQGETGVGKELVARAIHDRSPRSGRPFVTVNCGTLPANLVESELFGHERGAFTGATGPRTGRFELADRGTIFLDEIGDLPLDLQVKLLRVVQEGTYERVGSSRTRTTDVRVIAATHRNIEEQVRSGQFREDLYYRLNVYPLTIPPLRDRVGDIPILVHHLIRRLAARIGKAVEEVPGPAIKRLMDYHWPGNVRELENVLERALILSPDRVLVLPSDFDSAARTSGTPRTSAGLSTLVEAERQHILSALESTGWRLEGEKGAARILGINPSTLRSRMKKHGITRPPAQSP
ncbi:MAG: sigma 54-interacting transcriptional regulator [marine benthic group bacterium]|nr:sigma 54-interacting transcriptional regulator [Gemmatimonadota bacterium]